MDFVFAPAKASTPNDYICNLKSRRADIIYVI